jgi:ABC-type multidrug transport system fused ATPase/permease subunit
MGQSNLEVIVGYFKDHPLVTVGYALTMLVFPVGVVVIPAVSGQMVDNIKDGMPFSTWKPKLLLILGLFVVMIVAYMISLYLDSFTSTDFKGYLRGKMLDSVVQSRIYDYEPIQVSSLMTKLSNIPFGIFDLIKQFKGSLIPGTVTMLTVVAFFFYTDVRIGAVVLALLIGMVGIMVGGAYTCQDGLVASEYGKERLMERQGDTLDTLRATVLTDARQDQKNKQQVDGKQQKERAFEAMNCVNHFTGIVQVFVGVFMVGVILYSYAQMKRGFIGTDQMMSILFVLMTSRSVLFSAMSTYPYLLQNNSDVIKLGYFLDLNEERIQETNAVARDKQPEATPQPAGSAPVDESVLEFDNVAFAYRNSTHNILRNVNFEILPHDYALVKGKIGCGKSTMAVLANGMHMAAEGIVRLLGRDITTISRRELSKLVVYVPQKPDIQNTTLFDNVAMGTTVTHKEVKALLKKYEIDFVGIDERLGKFGSKISGGQQLMVALMRAMVRKDTMRLFIADEITANLDTATVKRVMRIIEDISDSGVAVLFISHSPPPNTKFTKILEIADHTVNIC